MSAALLWLAAGLSLASGALAFVGRPLYRSGLWHFAAAVAFALALGCVVAANVVEPARVCVCVPTEAM